MRQGTSGEEDSFTPVWGGCRDLDARPFLAGLFGFLPRCARRKRRGVCGGAGAAQELIEGVGEVGLVLLPPGPLFHGCFHEPPGLFAEGFVDVVAVDPRHFGQAAVGQPYPDLP
ncbi:hypothetical protein BX283_0005 [Streptomyces sp. TLI_146]|nr:hypothetical protein BX283_0005 [Streptomyces sp. TLI_146]